MLLVPPVLSLLRHVKIQSVLWKRHPDRSQSGHLEPPHRDITGGGEQYNTVISITYSDYKKISITGPDYITFENI